MILKQTITWEKKEVKVQELEEAIILYRITTVNRKKQKYNIHLQKKKE